MRLWIEVEYDAGHRLPMHPGLCKNVHGHRYKLQVAFKRTDGRFDHKGMVVDFSVIKKAVRRIVEEFDHAYVHSPTDTVAEALPEWQRKVEISCIQPTAELMAMFIFSKIEGELQTPNLEVAGLKLYETPTSWVEIP